MNTPETDNKWLNILAENPQHSANYAQRWVDFRTEGRDIDGEARLIDAMATRSSRILDIGAGTGRTGGYLAQRGHEVIGVDLDEYLVSVARNDFPQATWLVGDIENPDVVAQVHDAAGRNAAGYGTSADTAGFDIAVAAGQVFGFLAPAGRRPALENTHRLLADGGRAVIGFGSDRGYDFEEFFADARAAGFAHIQKFSTWELHPFQVENSGFVVAILTKGDSPEA